MAKYIDADEAIKICEETRDEICASTKGRFARFRKRGLYNTVIYVLRLFPAANVVPVVYAQEIPDGRYGTVDPLCQRTCSRCGAGHVGVVYGGKGKHCPNCGAIFTDKEVKGNV